jgi:hypothetical protein
MRYIFDFGRLFAAIFAAKGLLMMGFDISNAIGVAAAVPIVLEPFKRRFRMTT